MVKSQTSISSEIGPPSDPGDGIKETSNHFRPSRRGRLKIFLGSAPGVGKTYKMLHEAARKKAEGVDVVVGCVETHGYSENERLLAGIETVARRVDDGHGRVVQELDAAAVLSRAPQLVLVENMAHPVPSADNTPTTRHQLLQALLKAGIDVFATLNVQSLESVNERMAQISRIRLRDTLPDLVIREADEVELVDLAPEELIQRLRDGRVAVEGPLAQSMRRFFSRHNLTLLREMAMRVIADRLNALVIGAEEPQAATSDRLLVCINETPSWRRILRAGRRLAEAQHIPWTVVYVQPRTYEQLDDAARGRITQAMRLAERLGAEVVTLSSGGNLVEDILSFAERRGVTRLIVGSSRRRGWRRLRSRTVDRQLVEKGRGIEVTVVLPEEAERGPAAATSNGGSLRSAAFPYLVATSWVCGALGLALVLASFMPLHNVALIFLAGVVLVAFRQGLWPSIYASFLSFLAYNFFFTEPAYSLAVRHEEDILTIFFFLVIATVTAQLAARVRAQVDEIRLSARRIENLYDFSRRVVATVSLDDTLWAVVSHVASALGCHAMVLLPGGGGKLEISSAYPPEDRLDGDDRAAAERAWQHGRPAGWDEPESEGGNWLFIPLRTAAGPIGLLGVTFEDRRQQLSPEHRRLLEAVVDQTAMAVERSKLAIDIEEARILSETEHLRSALLSSISHDLRTPLASILGSATTLTDLGDAIAPNDRGELVRTIRRESERLNRFVQNLLDMTRLGAGALEPKRDWVDLRDVLWQAVRDRHPTLEDLKVEVRTAPDLPLLFVDPVLIGQVVLNLLENAARHAPLGSTVVVGAERDGDDVAVTVTDGGPGIPAGDRAAVFDMFYRVRGTDRHTSGTGLGLAICKGLVEAHGGSIAALPGPGERGTTIRFRLPNREPPPLPPSGVDE